MAETIRHTLPERNINVATLDADLIGREFAVPQDARGYLVVRMLTCSGFGTNESFRLWFEVFRNGAWESASGDPPLISGTPSGAWPANIGEPEWSVGWSAWPGLTMRIRVGGNGTFRSSWQIATDP